MEILNDKIRFFRFFEHRRPYRVLGVIGPSLQRQLQEHSCGLCGVECDAFGLYFELYSHTYRLLMFSLNVITARRHYRYRGITAFPVAVAFSNTRQQAASVYSWHDRFQDYRIPPFYSY